VADGGVDLDRWAVVAHKDFTGFGRQADMIKHALGLRKHIVIPSLRLEDRPLEPPNDVLLRPEDSAQRVREVFAGLQGIIFFERHTWHPELLKVARELGLKTVCVVNWEWFRDDPGWDKVDLFVCPSQWTLQVVTRHGYQKAVHLVWPIDLASLPERHVSGPARHFIHNAGLVDPQDRKGTRDTIQAFKRVRNPDVRLTVRMQKAADLPSLDSRIELLVGNLDDPAELYQTGEVAIQPSKLEGIGFMVLEPWACGIPVITLNYPPMNEYVTEPALLVKPRWGKRRAFPTAWVPHAHLRLPQTGDLVRRIEWCAEHDLSKISERARAWACASFDPESIRRSWASAFAQTLRAKQ